MSTVALACPYCGGWMRVAVQASSVTRTQVGEQLLITFDDQTVAHVCKPRGAAAVRHLSAPGPASVEGQRPEDYIGKWRLVPTPYGKSHLIGNARYYSTGTVGTSVCGQMQDAGLTPSVVRNHPPENPCQHCLRHPKWRDRAQVPKGQS